MAPVFQVILTVFPSCCIPVIVVVNAPVVIIGPEVSLMVVMTELTVLLVLYALSLAIAVIVYD